MTTPKRGAGDWSKEGDCNELESAIDSIATPGRKKRKNYGLGARGRNVGGEQRLASRPVSGLTEIEALDRHGNPMSRKAKAGAPLPSTAKQSQKKLSSSVATSPRSFFGPGTREKRQLEKESANRTSQSCRVRIHQGGQLSSSQAGRRVATKPSSRRQSTGSVGIGSSSGSRPGDSADTNEGRDGDGGGAGAEGVGGDKAQRGTQKISITRHFDPKRQSAAKIEPGASLGLKGGKSTMRTVREARARKDKAVSGRNGSGADRWDLQDDFGGLSSGAGHQGASKSSDKAAKIPAVIKASCSSSESSPPLGNTPPLPGLEVYPIPRKRDALGVSPGSRLPLKRNRARPPATRAGGSASTAVMIEDDSDEEDEEEAEDDQGREVDRSEDGAEGPGTTTDSERVGSQEAGKAKGDESPTQSPNVGSGETQEVAGNAVLIGRCALLGKCKMRFHTESFEIILPSEKNAAKTKMRIPREEVTFFGFGDGDGSKKDEEPFIALRVVPDGKIAGDQEYGRYIEHGDKGAAGLIAIFLVRPHSFRKHKEAVFKAIKDEQESNSEVTVDTNVGGELAKVIRLELRSNQPQAEEDSTSGSVRTRSQRFLKSESPSVMFHYPPEASETDRVAINSMDEARTQDGEFLNDSLVDLCLKYIYKEEFHTWGTKPTFAGGSCAIPKDQAMHPKQEDVYVFTSHFFTKLREYKIDKFGAAYAQVQHWTPNVNLFTKKFVLVPVVENMHWSLACLVNLGELKKNKSKDDFGPNDLKPCMLFFDSLNMHPAKKIWRYLSRYLEERWKAHDQEQERGQARGQEQEMWKARGQECLRLESGTFPLVQPNVPNQENGCDCGVFVLRYAKEIFQQWPAVTSSEAKNNLESYFGHGLFSSKDIRDERQRLREILKDCKQRYDEEQKKSGKAKGSGKGRRKDTGQAPGDNGDNGNGAASGTHVSRTVEESRPVSSPAGAAEASLRSAAAIPGSAGPAADSLSKDGEETEARCPTVSPAGKHEDSGRGVKGDSDGPDSGEQNSSPLADASSAESSSDERPSAERPSAKSSSAEPPSAEPSFAEPSSAESSSAEPSSAEPPSAKSSSAEPSSAKQSAAEPDVVLDSTQDSSMKSESGAADDACRDRPGESEKDDGIESAAGPVASGASLTTSRTSSASSLAEQHLESKPQDT